MSTRHVRAATLHSADDPVNPLNDFHSLSLADLLEARDLYHLHLTERKGVIATAVGRYLMRKEDSFPGQPKRKGMGPKTLQTTEVRSYSWPCVLVFVEEWIDLDQMQARGLHPTDIVPQVLHMPNGKVVPVCVVEAPREPLRQDAPQAAVFPKTFIGGGYPVIADVQGEQHIASIGCLVTDGNLVYALTNRHVAGRPGTPLYSLLDGNRVEIGRSSAKQLGRLRFKDVYAGWQGQNVYLNVDVALIEILDKNSWTPQVYSIGVIDQLADLSIENISLHLVNADVRAYGCASHEMFGRVWALFYRYKSVGGFEYVSDLFIGPRPDREFQTYPGDSGTLWLLEPPQGLQSDDVQEESAHERPSDDVRMRRGAVGGNAPAKRMLRPIALQWGGHVFTDTVGVRRQSYALATLLSTVCDRLQVDLVRDWGQALPEYWGTVGHFTIAAMACRIAGKKTSSIRELMSNNLLNITFQVEDISIKTTKGLSKGTFVPLADVPDLAWKIGPFQRGPRSSNPEAPNHFADLDETPPDGGPTLLELCKDPDNIVPDVWIEHVRKFPARRGRDPAKTAGLLPFRVWQIYDEMVRFAAGGDRPSFVCAAGVLAHYVGDACQPLHISHLHHGDPNRPETEQGNDAGDVHADYEQNMFRGDNALQMKSLLQDALDGQRNNRKLIKGGREAAVRTVQMMQSTFDTIPPSEIVNFYNDALETHESKSEILDALWHQFGERTATVMAGGCRLLALLWESAWVEGGGEAKIHDLGDVARRDLIARYSKRSFLPSFVLTEIGAHLRGIGGNGRSGSGAGPRTEMKKR